MIIAVDGPAASGKGTLARRIADARGYHYLDTGLLYRAVANDVIRLGFKLTDPWAAIIAARSLDPSRLDDPRLRTAESGEAASLVAAVPAVRRALLAFQHEFSRREPGAVLDGRDIGTVVCPNAEIKIFVTASPEVRAKRRHRELTERGQALEYDEVLKQILTRDARDADRQLSPMKLASDASLLDTSALDIDAAYEAALQLIERMISRPGRVQHGSNLAAG